MRERPTLAEIVEGLAKLAPADPGFAEDLEEIQGAATGAPRYRSLATW